MDDAELTPDPEELVRCTESTRALALQLLRDSSAAEDAAQDAWLAALEGTRPADVPLRWWLRGIVRHVAWRFVRSETRRRRHERDGARRESVASGVESAAQRAEMHKVLAEAVLALEEPYRATVLLRFFDGLSSAEIAECTGERPGTVRMRLKRALDMVRARLDREHEGERRTWALLLVPLLHRPRGTTAAAVLVGGGIAVNAMTKAALGTVAVLLLAVGAWRWMVSVEGFADAPEACAPSPEVEAPPLRAATVVAPVPQPVSTRFGVDGTTHVGGEPAPAEVGAWPCGVDRDPDYTVGPPAFGRPWSEVPEPSQPTTRTTSDAAGAFALEGLGRGAWIVVATFAGGRRAAQRVDLSAESPRARVVLAAPAGGYQVHGRAIHGDGTPFVGWIGLWRNDAPGDSCVWVTSDATGAFAFAGLPLGSVTVYALRAGSPLANAWVRLPCEEEVVLTVAARGTTRQGRVVAATDGTPVAGATVVSLTRSGRTGRGGVSTRTTTGSDGRFEFVAADGRANLQVRAEGFVTVRANDDGTGDEVLIRLDRRALLTGRVVRADDGTAVAGAVVCAATGGAPFTGETRTTSGPEGEFRLETCVVGRVDVYVVGGGWVSEGLADADRRGFDAFAHEIAPGSSSEIVLRVVPTARVDGRVMDAKGEPVPAMTVEARRAVREAPLALNQSFPETVTAADGAFSFADLIPGADWSFRVRPPVGEPKATEPVRLASGSSTKVEIRLDPMRHVAVRVLADGTDAPIANALVSVATASHGPWDNWNGSNSSWTTDANGTVTVGRVGASCIGIYARAPGFVENHVAPETVDESMLRAVVRLVPGKPLTGRVVRPDGVPLDVVTVVLAENQARNYVRTDVDAEGRFRFDTLPDEVWTLSVAATWAGHRYEASRSAHPGDSDVVLTLVERSASPSMQVRVSDAQGSPLAAGVVSYSFSSGALYITGDAAIHAGSASVVLPAAPATGFLDVRPTPLGLAGSGTLRVDLPDPLPRAVDVRLPPEQRITGRVIGATGEGLPGVRVLAQPTGVGVAAARGEDRAHGVALTGQYGTFDLGGLGAFTYRLQCIAPPGLAQRSPVEAAAGASGIEIRLSAGTAASVTVKGPDGTPLAGCVVSVSLGDAPAGSDLTSQTGKAAFTDLDAAAVYALEVHPPQFREDLVGTTLPSWKPQDITVQLESAGAITGTVRDDQGRAIPWATVICLSSSQASTTTAGADGRFRMVGVRTDEAVRLRVHLDGEQDMASVMPQPPLTDVRAKVGAGDVVLVVGTSDLVSIRVEGAPEGVATSWSICTAVRSGDERGRAGFVNRDGVLRFRGLDPSLRHRLFVGPTSDGRVGLTDNLVVGAPEVSLRLMTGVPLSGQMTLPTGVAPQDVTVTARGDLWTARTSVDAQGRFRFPGLPAESCRITVIARRGGELVFAGNATAGPGSDVTIELTPWDGGDVPR